MPLPGRAGWLASHHDKDYTWTIKKSVDPFVQAVKTQSYRDSGLTWLELEVGESGIKKVKSPAQRLKAGVTEPNSKNGVLPVYG